MSLTLSGCLGRAQLGAVELGGFQTVTAGAGFPVFFPDSGPKKPAEAPKKKKPKKPRLKKPKRVKVKASITFPTPAPVSVTETTFEEPAPVSWLDIFTVPESVSTKSVDTAAQRLRETIAEEDELLVMLWNKR